MQLVIFYTILSIPIIIWTLIVLPNFLGHFIDVPISIISNTYYMSPVIGGDLSIFGELTPIILAGSIIALMPSTSSRTRYVAIFLATVAYALYIYLSIYFTSGAGVGLLSAAGPDSASLQKGILNIIGNIRITMLVITASLLGYTLRSDK